MTSNMWSDLEPITEYGGVCLHCCGQILPEALQIRTICTHTQVGMTSNRGSNLEPITEYGGVCLHCCGQILPEAL
jgi:hypothetical protein